jgi:rod shape-determining protein MreD
MLMPVVAPGLRLLYFAPFLILLFYQKSLPYSLWCAFFCGLMIDLVSVQPPFGFYACNYTLASAIIWYQKRHFFADHLSTLPIMTFLFSFTATLLEVIFLYFFGAHVSLGLQWIFSDLFVMPAGDALYAFLWFILIPLSLKKKTQRRSI